MAKRNQHVLPHPKGSAVMLTGAGRQSSVHRTQHQAIDLARENSRNDKEGLLVHGNDRHIRRRDSHGLDPFPPTG